MSHYQHHIFFCTNKREDGRQCCESFNAKAMRDYAKKRCKELGISASNKVRVNTAGCLNRCELGPVAVVYPEETWYTFIDKEDVDEIIEQHLLNDTVVERLKID